MNSLEEKILDFQANQNGRPQFVVIAPIIGKAPSEGISNRTNQRFPRSKKWTVSAFSKRMGVRNIITQPLQDVIRTIKVLCKLTWAMDDFLGPHRVICVNTLDSVGKELL